MTVKIDAKFHADESTEISSILTVSISNGNRIEGLNNTYVIMKGGYAWPFLSFYPYFPSESEISITSYNSNIAKGEWDDEDDEQPFGIRGNDYGTAKVSLNWGELSRTVDVYVPNPNNLSGFPVSLPYFFVNQGEYLDVNISCASYPAIIKEGSVTASNSKATLSSIQWIKNDAIIEGVNYGELYSGCKLRIYGNANGEGYFSYLADGVKRGFYIYVIGTGSKMDITLKDLRNSVDYQYLDGNGGSGDYDYVINVDNNDDIILELKCDALITRVEFLGAHKTMGEIAPASLISTGEDTDLKSPGDYCDQIMDLYDNPKIYMSKDSNCEYYFKVTFGKNKVERLIKIRFRSDR